MALIQTQVQPNLDTTTGYDPERINLDEEDTVAGRIKSLIAQDSPVAQQAVTRANQQSNRRGLLNSSIAVGAGQSALYDYALPIASQDAQTSFQAKSLNQQAGNQAQQFTAGSSNTAQLQKAAGEQSLAQISKQGEIQKGLIGTQLEADIVAQREQGNIQSRLVAEKGQIDKDLQTADAATRLQLLDRQSQIDKELAQIQGDVQSRLTAERGQIDKDMQTADAATRLQLQERQSQIDKEMAQIQGTIQSDLQAKKGEIDKQLQTADSATRLQLQAQQASIDKELATVQGQIQSRLTAERGQIDKELQTADIDSRLQLQARQLQNDKEMAQVQSAISSRLQDEKGRIDMQLQGADAATRQALLERQGQIDSQLQVLRGDQAITQINLNTASQMQLQAQNAQLQKELQAADAVSREALMVKQGEINKELERLSGEMALDRIRATGIVETDLQILRGDQQKELADIENQWGMLRQSSQSAALVMSQSMASIGAILSAPDMTPAAKQTLVDKQTQMLRSQLDVIGTIGNLDLSGIIPSATPGVAPNPSAKPYPYYEPPATIPENAQYPWYTY